MYMGIESYCPLVVITTEDFFVQECVKGNILLLSLFNVLMMNYSNILSSFS